MNPIPRPGHGILLLWGKSPPPEISGVHFASVSRPYMLTTTLKFIRHIHKSIYF